MENKNEKVQDREGFRQYLKILIFINKRAIIALLIAIPLPFIVMQISDLKVPNSLLIILLFLTLTLSIYLYLLSKKVRKINEAENIGLAYLISNVIFYTFIIHYLGGIEGIGIIIYFFVIIEANILLPVKKSILVILAAIISFSTLGFLEYYEVIPHYELFLTEPKTYNNFYYLLFVIFFGAILAFNYAGLIARRFSNVYRGVSQSLRKERKELVKTQSELKEARDTLEVRVKARTKELEELTKNLEGQVQERTKELQEKIEELEKFQKFAVGRELKMTELKNKIKELEGKKE